MKTYAEYYRQDWMDDDQWECAEAMAHLLGGWHHVYGIVKRCGSGILINARNCRFATYDFDLLTRAVIMAHDRCIRFEIQPSGPGMLQLRFHKRHKRDGGSMYERHPTLESHMATIRGVA